MPFGFRRGTVPGATLLPPRSGRPLKTTFSGKKGAHKLKKNPRDTDRVSLGRPAGQTGVCRPVSRELPAIYYRKIDRKRAFLPGHRPGVPGTPGRPGRFQKFYVIFSYVPFLLPTFDMTTLIFSSGGCPSYPFYTLKRVPSYPFLAENPSSEGATKDHLSSKPPQGEPPGTKNQSGR